MKMKISHLLKLFLGLFMISCSNKSTSNEHDYGYLKNINKYSDSENLILRTISKMKNKCLNQGRDFPCLFAETKFKKSKMAKSSQGHRIMIIDEGFFPKSFFLGNKNKIIEILRLNKDRKLTSYMPKYTIPSVIEKLNQELLANGGWPKSSQMKNVAPDLIALLHKVKKSGTNKYEAHHGTYIFDWLAFWNRHAQFVLTEFPEPQRSQLCSLDINQTLEDIEDLYRNAYENINESILKNKIDFVNLSYAPSLEKTKKYIFSNCNIHDFQIYKNYIHRFQEIKNNFILDLVKNNPKVLFIQAMPNELVVGPHLLEKWHPDSKLYCSLYENTFRLSYVNIPNSLIKKEGKLWVRKDIPYKQRNIVDCAHFLVNSGIDEKKAYHFLSDHPVYPSAFPQNKINQWWNEHSLFYNLDSVYNYPIELMSTSWSVPIGLSFIRYIISNYKIYSTEGFDLLHSFLDGKIFDPLKHKQFNY